MGTLNVYRELVGGEDDAESKIILSKSGEQGEDWINAQIKIESSELPSRVSIKNI